MFCEESCFIHVLTFWVKKKKEREEELANNPNIMACISTLVQTLLTIYVIEHDKREIHGLTLLKSCLTKFCSIFLPPSENFALIRDQWTMIVE